MCDQELLLSLLQGIIKNMRKVLDQEIAAWGIGHAEMRLLMVLFSGAEIRQEELTSRIEVDRSNVGRALKKLEALGYIRRTKAPDDNRSYMVVLTEAGRDLKTPLLKIKGDLEETIGMGVSDEDMAVLISLLKTLGKNMSEKNYRMTKGS